MLEAHVPIRFRTRCLVTEGNEPFLNQYFAINFNSLKITEWLLILYSCSSIKLSPIVENVSMVEFADFNINPSLSTRCKEPLFCNKPSG